MKERRSTNGAPLVHMRVAGVDVPRCARGKGEIALALWITMAQVTRKIELFTVHAHALINDDYELLFSRLSRLPSKDRIYVNRGLFLGFPIFQLFEGGYFVQAIEGVDGEAPLVFDVSSGDTRSEQLPRNEIYAHATHLFARPAERRILVEYVRRGAKSSRIGNAIENIARESIQGYQNLRVEITPKISTNFSSQVNNFERIREAAIRVVRPNASWTDHYTQIADLIEDSSGNSATVDVKAGRGEALAKRKGIVQVIKDVVRDKEPYLQEATVTGTRPEETAEVTIRASKFISQSQTRVEADVNKNVAPTDMRSKLAQMASSLTSLFL